MNGTRYICLDTETTGLSASNDRVCEIAALEFDPETFEIVESFHTYLNPCRDVPYYATRVHGLTAGFLRDKPVFAEITDDFLDFVGDSHLLIHNSSFDTRMLNSELSRVGVPTLDMQCRSITCTLRMANALRGRGRNKLDDLCRDFGIDASMRTLHGALVDTQLLVRVVHRLVMMGARLPD
ncbi:MAG: exonuclease domain-containing protein [Sutterellaceae bacterium]|nr:exonuclease domain-containing protein [Sutterellaceae bacterium]